MLHAELQAFTASVRAAQPLAGGGETQHAAAHLQLEDVQISITQVSP